MCFTCMWINNKNKRTSKGEGKDKWEKFYVRVVIMNQLDRASGNLSCSLVDMPDSWYHLGLRWFFKFYFKTTAHLHAALRRNTERCCVRMKVLIGMDNRRREVDRTECETKAVVFSSGTRTLNWTCRKVKSAERSQWAVRRRWNEEEVVWEGLDVLVERAEQISEKQNRREFKEQMIVRKNSDWNFCPWQGMTIMQVAEVEQRKVTGSKEVKGSKS